MVDSQELVDELEKLYCPPLDTALYLAIISEYDLSTIDGLKNAKDTLNSLTEGCDVEEASGFDPSGSGGGRFLDGHDGNEQSETGQSAPDWSSTTDSTSLSQGMSAMDLGSQQSSPSHNKRSVNSNEERPPAEYHAQWEELDTAAKEAMLMETFPTAKPFDIRWTLKKCKGNASLAIDELLNKDFLEQSGGIHKGIEAFSEADISSRPRKGKGKKKRSKMADSSDYSESDIATPELSSKWTKAKDDINFIAERTNMLPHQISSMYHKHNGSISATVSALIDAHLELGLVTKDDSTQRAAHALQPTYPSIPLTRLIAIVQLTHPSRTHASDFAKVLTHHSPPATRNTTPIQLELRYAPPDLNDTTPNSTAHKAGLTAPSSLYPSDPNPYLPSSSTSLSALRSHAYNSASAAHRKGKSDALMGAAAGYYSSVARDLSVRMHASTAAEMDALVAAQSTSEMCDLHGCDVKNGVRIASERVGSWWLRKAGTAARAAGVGAHNVYTVVTGKGIHSEGGRSRLQPAVVRMLIAEGWKVEVLSGSVVVRGVQSSSAGKRK